MPKDLHIGQTIQAYLITKSTYIYGYCYETNNPYYKALSRFDFTMIYPSRCVTSKYTNTKVLTGTSVSIPRWKCVLHNVENHKGTLRGKSPEENIQYCNNMDKIPQVECTRFTVCRPERAQLTEFIQVLGGDTL